MLHNRFSGDLDEAQEEGKREKALALPTELRIPAVGFSATKH